MNAPAKTGLRVKSPVPARFPAYQIVSEAGELLATVPITASGDSGKLAHVMAAAPELLEAARQTKWFIENGRELGFVPIAPSDPALKAVLAAIAKAEGAS